MLVKTNVILIVSFAGGGGGLGGGLGGGGNSFQQMMLMQQLGLGGGKGGMGGMGGMHPLLLSSLLGGDSCTEPENRECTKPNDGELLCGIGHKPTQLPCCEC